MSPVYSRQNLRQTLGKLYTRDVVVGRTTGSWGTTAGSTNIIDSTQADPTASGEQLYWRSWMRLLGTVGKLQDLRVGSFNTGSGAYLAAITLVTTIFSGMPFEIHTLLSPTEKDEAMDEVIKNLRVNQELPLWSVDESYIYSLGPDVLDILDLRYYSDPTDSLNHGEHKFTWWKFEQTATGQELRVRPALPASYQLIIDAMLALSLGAGELATINLPTDGLVLWGATARCMWLLEQQSPAKEADRYQKRRAEAAREVTRLAKRFQPKITRKIQLDELW